jgi:hypothetical protein
VHYRTWRSRRNSLLDCQQRVERMTVELNVFRKQVNLVEKNHICAAELGEQGIVTDTKGTMHCAWLSSCVSVLC